MGGHRDGPRFANARNISPCHCCSRPGTSRKQHCTRRTSRCEKDRLFELTLQQRRDILGLDRDCDRFRARVAKAELVEADRACEKCVIDVESLELEQLASERKRLEEELEAWRGRAARLRGTRLADSRADSERAAWESEQRRLQADIAQTREELSSLEDAANRHCAELSNIAWHQSAAASLEEELARQRRLRAEAEETLRNVQAEAGVEHRSVREVEEVGAKRTKVHELRSELAHETNQRRQHAAEVQAALSDLDQLRLEIEELTAENARLRHLERARQAADPSVDHGAPARGPPAWLQQCRN